MDATPPISVQGLYAGKQLSSGNAPDDGCPLTLVLEETANSEIPVTGSVTVNLCWEALDPAIPRDTVNATGAHAVQGFHDVNGQLILRSVVPLADSCAADFCIAFSAGLLPQDIDEDGFPDVIEGQWSVSVQVNDEVYPVPREARAGGQLLLMRSR